MSAVEVTQISAVEFGRLIRVTAAPMRRQRRCDRPHAVASRMAFMASVVISVGLLLTSAGPGFADCDPERAPTVCNVVASTDPPAEAAVAEVADNPPSPTAAERHYRNHQQHRQGAVREPRKPRDRTAKHERNKADRAVARSPMPAEAATVTPLSLRPSVFSQTPNTAGSDPTEQMAFVDEPAQPVASETGRSATSALLDRSAPSEAISQPLPGSSMRDLFDDEFNTPLADRGDSTVLSALQRHASVIGQASASTVGFAVGDASGDGRNERELMLRLWLGTTTILFLVLEGLYRLGAAGVFKTMSLHWRWWMFRLQQWQLERTDRTVPPSDRRPDCRQLTNQRGLALTAPSRRFAPSDLYIDDERDAATPSSPYTVPWLSSPRPLRAGAGA
jgi:hypothetical protein